MPGAPAARGVLPYELKAMLADTRGSERSDLESHSNAHVVDDLPSAGVSEPI